jgi:hypothetical protein
MRPKDSSAGEPISRRISNVMVSANGLLVSDVSKDDFANDSKPMYCGYFSLVVTTVVGHSSSVECMASQESN